MTLGHIPDLNMGVGVLNWSEGEVKKNSLGAVQAARVRYSIEAHRCPTCGLVEMHALKRAY